CRRCGSSTRSSRSTWTSCSSTSGPARRSTSSTSSWSPSCRSSPWCPSPPRSRTATASSRARSTGAFGTRPPATPYATSSSGSSRDSIREIVESALDHKTPHGSRTALDLLERVEKEDPEAVDAMRREMTTFRPRFIVNQVRTNGDIPIGHQLVSACARHLGVRASYAGFVHYDDAVWQCVRKRKLFMNDAPTSTAAEEIRQLAPGLLRGESLALPW